MLVCGGLLALALNSCGAGGDVPTTINEPSGGDGAGGVGAAGSSNGGASGDSAGATSDRGVRVPDLEIDPYPGTSPTVEVRDSTLMVGTSPTSLPLLLWLFTMDNTGEYPACDINLEAWLFDEQGEILAGGPHADETAPAAERPYFYATVKATPYYAPGRAILLSCIAPGEHGLGVGAVTAGPGQPVELAPDEVARVIDQTARIEFRGGGGRPMGTEEPATDLLGLEELVLSDTPEGKVVSGSVTAGTDVSYWQVQAGLFDRGGQIVDYVTSFDSGIGDLPKGESVEFELPPGSATAIRFEAYIEGWIQQ